MLSESPFIPADLTSREKEVLRLMSEGLGTREISAQLGISYKTAACHKYRITQKLYADSTLEAVASAIRQGIIAA